MLESDAVCQRHPDALFTDLGEEFVAMDVTLGEYFFMSSSAARIWSLIETPTTFAALCDDLCKAYNVDRQQCAADVSKFLQELADANLARIT